MQLSELDFAFNPDLVATHPVLPRDQARLLVLDRPTGELSHRHVCNLPSLLQPGDLLVVNDTKVMPARVAGRKQPGGAPVEVLFVKDLGDRIWEILVKGKYRPGQTIVFDGGASATIVKRDATGTHVQVRSAIPVPQFLQEQGAMPLPPYIKRASIPEDHEWYQTLFAKNEGAIAAPTAGLHFTPQLLSQLTQQGIRLVTVTLHVGPGTFKPVSVERIEDHQMGEEAFEISEETAQAIRHTKQAGRRVVAVGTTVVRALETMALQQKAVASMAGQSRLFITPGFHFQVVDALMTNFHLPRTTLLLLVSAFADVHRIRTAYEIAVRERYRFYSYGDAMLIL
jgi:S-adenosylmethionine:tRNA ribosyltransferase-isomerase